MPVLFFVFVCVVPFLPRNDITHHKHHFMPPRGSQSHTHKTLRYLFRNTNFTQHAQSAQRLVVLILIQEAALTFEIWANKDEGPSKGNYIKCWIRLNYLLLGLGGNVFLIFDFPVIRIIMNEFNTEFCKGCQEHACVPFFPPVLYIHYSVSVPSSNLTQSIFS